MKIAIALFDGCYGSSFTGLQDVFYIANYFLPSSENTFEVSLLSSHGQPTKLAGGGEISTEKNIESLSSYDLIYLPAFAYINDDSLHQMINENKALLNWIHKAWENGATLAANCTSTFLLAETGLLDHKTATTTWWLEPQFRRRYPAVKLDRRAIITNTDRIMCAGAITSSYNLALEMVTQYASPELAIKCARTMMIDTSRQVQPFIQSSILEGKSSHPTLIRAQHWMQAHMQEKIKISRLAEHLGVSSRSLNRYFRNELDMTTLEYLQCLRVENAKIILEKTKRPLAQVVADVGYSDLRSFTILFERQVGMKPAEFRAKAYKTS